ncbi:MAG TPA: alpha-isopropylmalate synthase regulatory domain-containing protein, partial [Candidatus Omnitrophota bacterium]|nr:alpha-isopropylmalate synthase regulatory domain-containing protein [Candidatus Omnitrophota bacterium]
TTTSGTDIAPKATVKLRAKGKTEEKTSSGDGPVDACYKAIASVTKVKPKLLDYSIRSITQGDDAQGEVSVKVSVAGKNVLGRAASTDIIEASAKAYINAINKAIQR